MGSEQFATGMTSEDKAQLNRIETNTKNVVQDYTVHGVTVKPGTYTDVVNITGKGNLKHAIVNAQDPSSTTHKGYIKIIIDGSVIFEGHTSGNTGISGIAYVYDVDPLFHIGGTYSYLSYSNSAYYRKNDLPYTDTSVNSAVHMMDGIIPFNSSLVVQVYTTDTLYAVNPLVIYEVK